MNRSIRAAAFSAILAVLAACGEHRTLTPKSSADLTVGRGMLTAAAQLPEVRISEFHYDNGADDVDELVEISGPAGMSLDGWSLVLYNGNPSARSPYSTTSLDGYTIPTTEGCGARGVLVITPVSDIPDASTSRTATNDPDGMALVNGSAVVDLLAYEGTFVAVAGVAADRTFPNIGVRERGVAPEPTTAPVWSLKRDITNVWSGPSLNSFGSCNDNEPPAAQEVDHISVTPGATSVALGATQQLTATAFDAANAKIDGASTSWSSSDPLTASVDAAGLVTTFRTGVVTITVTAPNDTSGTAVLHIEDAGVSDVRFTEFHYDNAGSDVNEFIEIEGSVGTDLTGWTIALYDGDSGSMYYSHVIEGALTDEQCGGRATLFIGPPAEIFQNGRPVDGSGNADGVALIKPADELHPYPQVVEFLSYEGVLTATDGPAEGKRSSDVGKTESSTTLRTESLQRLRDGSGWYGPSAATFGACNVDPVVTVPNTVLFTGRGQTDPVLPVGFEDQLVATEYDAVTNEPVPTTFIWTTETSDISTVNGNGVVHAWAPGEAIIRATAADGATATWKLQLGNPAVSTTADWTGNTEFGEPVGANDAIVRRDQFTASMSHDRNIPNWVSARLEASHFGASDDRCDCFTYDPLLPPNFPRYTTADYPAPSEIVADFERGRMLPSAELTASDGDNKFGYLFSNVVPMAHPLRVGAWAALESHLGELARSGKDVFMIAGAAGSAGTVKNQDRITIPASVWKVAVILPHGQGRADVHSASDLEVIAVIMPNDASANVDWTAYRTSVDAVEALSGYDLLALLPDQIEIEVESGSRPAVAALDGPYVGVEGSAVAMSAEGSSDPDGDAITAYDWAFGDGSTGTGVAASHTYAQQGVYTVTLTVTEAHGLVSGTTSTVTVANVAPAIGTFAGATVSIGETYTASGTFTDPGADTWTATVDYGDGAAEPLALDASDRTFTLSHVYAGSGRYSVVVAISDGTTTSTSSALVVVRARPVASITGVLTSTEGASVALSGAASSDADGTIQSHVWNFGDGSTASGANVSHTYTSDGGYVVTLTVTDNDGLTDVSTATVQVQNVAPVISALPAGAILEGESYSANGSFTDPGADSWTATVDYGEGQTVALALAGKSFTLSHTYALLGTFTIAVRISDDDTTTLATAVVTVMGVAEALQRLDDLSPTGALKTRMDAVIKHFDRSQHNPTITQLNGYLTDLDTAVRTGQMTAAQAAPLRDLAQRIIAAL